MLSDTDTYMELIIFLILWGFTSYLHSREKHPAHCTTKIILIPPEKAIDQILHSQWNILLSFLSGCGVDISILNIFSSELVAQKYFLPTRAHERRHLPCHSIGMAMKQLWDLTLRYQQDMKRSWEHPDKEYGLVEMSLGSSWLLQSQPLEMD